MNGGRSIQPLLDEIGGTGVVDFGFTCSAFLENLPDPDETTMPGYRGVRFVGRKQSLGRIRRLVTSIYWV